jgi:deoxyribonuclease V
MKVADLRKEQLRLAKKVITKDEFDQLEYIGGCAQTYIEKKVISAVAVLEYKTLKVVEKKYACVAAPIQYIPGFLSYRESPAVVEAVSKLKQKPDVLLVPANGILHERKIGMASHLGILLDMPTIGLAKKLSLGEEKEGEIIVDGEKRGVLFETKEHARPLYLSIGHRVSLKTAQEIAKKCMVEKHKMPEPLHEAHKYSNKIRDRLMEKEGETDTEEEKVSE